MKGKIVKKGGKRIIHNMKHMYNPCDMSINYCWKNNKYRNIIRTVNGFHSFIYTFAFEMLYEYIISYFIHTVLCIMDEDIIFHSSSTMGRRILTTTACIPAHQYFGTPVSLLSVLVSCFAAANKVW